jgi:hypothetical protein
MGIEIDSVDRKGCGENSRSAATGTYCFISGHGPFDASGNPLIQGRIGDDLDTGRRFCPGRLAAISMLATIKDSIGDLDRIDYFVKALGLINSVATSSLCQPR